MSHPRKLAAAAALLLFAAAGCELPTSAPRWTTTWELPADSTEVSVADLLPDNVIVVDNGSGKVFEASFGAVPLVKTLGSVCTACHAANGQRVEKPDFTIVDSSTAPLPVDVFSLDIVGGAVDYTITNRFSFDPLNPSATTRGWLRVVIRAGETILARDSVSGEALSLAYDVARTHTVILGGTPTAPVRIAGPITVVVTLASPAGDSVTINTAEEISVSVTPRAIRASQLSVNVTDRELPARSDTVDLSSMNDITGTIEGGAIILGVRNPFTVGGSLSVSLRAPDGAQIARTLTLPPGGSNAPVASLRLGLTEAEINSILGQSNVVTTVSGKVSSPVGAVTVLPTQVIVVTTSVEAAVRMGGN